MHISSDEVFSKILKKPSIVQKKMIPYMAFDSPSGVLPLEVLRVWVLLAIVAVAVTIPFFLGWFVVVSGDGDVP